jgi:hypothetical protein
MAAAGRPELGGRGLGVTLAVGLLGVSVAGAWLWTPPRRDAADQVRAAVSRALHGENVSARDLSLASWSKLFAFGPLKDRESISAVVGEPMPSTLAPVGPHERLLVFVAADGSVRTARIQRAPAELACLTADRERGVAPGTHVRVVDIELPSGETVMAAAASQPDSVLADCIQRLPAVPPR